MKGRGGKEGRTNHLEQRPVLLLESTVGKDKELVEELEDRLTGWRR